MWTAGVGLVLLVTAAPAAVQALEGAGPRLDADEADKAAIVLAKGSFSEPPADCEEQSQTGLSRCAAAEEAAAEQKLNNAYRVLMGKLPAPDQARLRDAQRAWIAWREKECLMRTGGGPDGGGTIAPMLLSECRRDVARERASFLEELIKCPPGDLACPDD